MADRTCITVFFPTPLIFRYHLPLSFLSSILNSWCPFSLFICSIIVSLVSFLQFTYSVISFIVLLSFYLFLCSTIVFSVVLSLISLFCDLLFLRLSPSFLYSIVLFFSVLLSSVILLSC